ncbi:putative Nuclear polyadenylated RNA-binding protein Nab2 [Taphrina deformans PYCC 5710]|uniref:Nuclear polyadenylated RNA-binding protein Nab2 n=1 Tax=Taphrina deformans (strain PYCC 5710 / ATCC 11124 / CBS 356.35 / IMI 108563 / JCM 9778 / NBRC 8474) TaxID=1097556 RepID=R4XJ51_TAPDE|nr:putative Nuclear polyadenylated RNA-binding protein Nab2 [Taphrina deformans PYCC 5710]|eukprot:CCG83400.1 putative Nuclear polyadenylated RNA-binding protein Nab2 [Taphrina deformans PYCC 5710]
MDTSMTEALQKGIEQELARRFDHDDSAMAEYIVVMLQNGKDAPALTEELNDLIANYDASFTQWVFRQVERLRAGESIESQASTNNLDDAPAEDIEMETDVQKSQPAGDNDDQGMGYPSSRLYSGLKKTLQDNGAQGDQRARHRPETNGLRATPYGTVAVGNGAMKVPTGPRAESNTQRTTNAGPVRTARGRGAKSNGVGRQQGNAQNVFPEMPQFPGFPMDPAQFFASMPLMDRIGGMDGVANQAPRAPSRRCTKWPTCFKGKACTFGHPTTMCQNPNCRRTDGTCVNIHADEDVDLLSGVEAQRRTEEEQAAKAAARESKSNKPQNGHQNGYAKAMPETDGSAPICKFGEACTNRACHFAHPSPASKNGSSIVLNSDACPAAIECKDENCSFSHPSPSNKYTPGVKLNTMAGEIMCRFNPCLNPSCRFQHGPGQKTQATFGGARNKVWTPATAAKSTAERTFVAGEVEEQFTTGSNVHDNDTEMEK